MWGVRHGRSDLGRGILIWGWKWLAGWLDRLVLGFWGVVHGLYDTLSRQAATDGSLHFRYMNINEHSSILSG